MYCCRVYIKVFEYNPKEKEDSGVSYILIVFNRVHQLKDGQGGARSISADLGDSTNNKVK